MAFFGILPVAQTVKRLPAKQETWDRSLGWEDPLEKEMATHSSVLARRIQWTEEPGRLQTMGPQSDMTERLTLLLWEAITVHTAVSENILAILTALSQIQPWSQKQSGKCWIRRQRSIEGTSVYPEHQHSA